METGSEAMRSHGKSGVLYNTDCLLISIISYMLNCFRRSPWLLFATLLVFVGGCAPTTPTPPAPDLVRTCDESGGPPSSEVLRCRLLRASDSGSLPRKISPAEVERLLADSVQLKSAMRSLSRKEITPAQYAAQLAAFEKLCVDLTGLACENLFYSPEKNQ